jgi:hypothetical protein
MVNQAKKDNYKWPEHFTLAVLMAPGLEVANVGKAWTPLLAKDTGMQVHLAHTTDKVNKFKWLHLGIADMADGGQHEVSRVLEGDRRYGVIEYCGQNFGRRAVVYGNRDCGAFPFQAVWVHSKYDSGFMVRGDSKIKDVYDIKPGIRVVDMRPYLASQRNIEGLFAWAKIDEKDVVWVPAHNTEEKVRLVVEGKADIAWVIPSAPSTYEAEKNPHGIRWIDLNSDKDPEGAKRFREKYLLIGFGPMIRGVASARGHWGTVGTDLFCCHANADAEFIYHLAKWMDENYPRYKDLHYWLPAMSRQNLMEELDTTFIPCHEGLIKYLKELGLWTPEHEKRNRQNAELVDRYCQATEEAHRLADEKGIIVAAENQTWVDLWEDYKKKLDLPVCDILPSLHKGRPESK